MAVNFNATFTESQSFTAAFAESNDISAAFEAVVTSDGRLPDYDGDYEITPLAYNNVELQTANKSMNDNVTVLEIPIYEVSNPHGTTINIGG